MDDTRVVRHSLFFSFTYFQLANWVREHKSECLQPFFSPRNKFAYIPLVFFGCLWPGNVDVYFAINQHTIYICLCIFCSRASVIISYSSIKPKNEECERMAEQTNERARARVSHLHLTMSDNFPLPLYFYFSCCFFFLLILGMENSRSYSAT